jgi:signal transduction histidine kinase
MNVTTLLVLMAAATVVFLAAVIAAAGRQRRRQRAQRMYERFLSALCHELRTPLNAMAGCLPMLESGSGEARRRATQLLERNVRVEAALIDELLGASEMLAGRGAPRFGPVDLSEILRSAVNRSLVFAQNRGVDVRLDLPTAGIIVAGDRRHLGQIASFLLAHAVQRVTPGGRVTAACRDDANGVHVAVSTNADQPSSSWLEPLRKHLPDVMQDGQQLGLSVMREMVTQHGGVVSIERRDRGGTTWVVTFPSLTQHGAATDQLLTRSAS